MKKVRVRVIGEPLQLLKYGSTLGGTAEPPAVLGSSSQKPVPPLGPYCYILR